MRIAVIGAKDISKKQGEIERYCQELYSQITVRGHQVDLFVQPRYHYQSYFSINYYQKIRVIALLSLPGKQLNCLFNSALNTIWATFGNYDVIHVHGLAAAWFTWFPQLFSTSPIIVTCHQLDCHKNKWHKMFHWLLPRLEKIAIQNADEIIVTSKALRNYLHQKYDVYPQYIATAPRQYPSSPHHHHYRQIIGINKTKYILYLGKFEPDKRLDLLIRAFQKLQPQNWQLILAGEIGYAPEYSSTLLSMAEGQENIMFIGEIRGNSRAEIVRGAKIFIEPSAGSDLDLSQNMLEAMREGIPILASDTIVHRKLLNGDRGLLFKSGELDSLLEQLAFAISQPRLLQTMAKKAQIYIAINHNWDKVTYKNLFLYLQLTGKMPFQAAKNQTLDT